MHSKVSERYGFFRFSVAALMAVTVAYTFFIANIASAQDQPTPAPGCIATDTACLLPELESLTAKIPEEKWRDQTWREVAKLYAALGKADESLAILSRIQNPDTRALTILGIGMEIARLEMPAEKKAAIFASLHADAAKITHPPSHEIALTYIAMAQAYAGDNAGAKKTAKEMDNPALRHKAFGETAEIQADRDDLVSALDSLDQIDDQSFRNKAHLTVSKIFSDHKNYNAALKTLERIDNDYQRSQALLYLAAKQVTPNEITLGIRE